MRSPRRSRNVATVAWRAVGSFPRSDFAMPETFGPDTRTTPIAPRPIGVAIAAMVSRSISSFGMGRLVAIEHALYLPLLEDGKDVVDQPIEHEAGGEEEEKDAEHEWHELHHLGLHRIGRHGIHPGLQHHCDG